MASPHHAEGRPALRQRRLLVAATMLLIPAAAQANVFCCDDAGHSVCADVLPPQCYGKAYRILSPQGSVIKRVPAPLTSEQLQAQREEEKRKRVEAERVRAEKMRERALLETYESISHIDVQQRRTEAEIEAEIDKARKAEEELLKQRSRLSREKEFYVGKPLPPELLKQLRDNEQEILGQRSVIEGKQKHIEAVRQRFEEDRRQYQQILDRRESLNRR